MSDGTEHLVELSPTAIEGFRRAIRHALASTAEMEKRLGAMKAEFEYEAARLRDLLIQADVRLCLTCGVRIAPGSGCPPERGYNTLHCSECRLAHDLY
jgi:hypothetical protein